MRLKDQEGFGYIFTFSRQAPCYLMSCNKISFRSGSKSYFLLRALLEKFKVRKQILIQHFTCVVHCFAGYLRSQIPFMSITDDRLSRRHPLCLGRRKHQTHSSQGHLWTWSRVIKSSGLTVPRAPWEGLAALPRKPRTAHPRHCGFSPLLPPVPWRGRHMADRSYALFWQRLCEQMMSFQAN